MRKTRIKRSHSLQTYLFSANNQKNYLYLSPKQLQFIYLSLNYKLILIKQNMINKSIINILYNIFENNKNLRNIFKINKNTQITIKQNNKNNTSESTSS